MKNFGLVFLIYLFLEVFVTIEVGSKMGGVGTFLEIIGSFFVGVFILVNFKHSIKASLVSLASMQIDSKEFVRMNLFSALGAILLIIPGILSDIIGVLMQFGVFTNFIVNYLPIRNSANYRFQKDNYKNSKNSKNEEIIDVEIIDDKSSK